MALPIVATAEDVRGIIAYLKNKPTGATISEAKAAVKKQLLNKRGRWFKYNLTLERVGSRIGAYAETSET